MDERKALKISVRRELALAEPGTPRRRALFGLAAAFWTAGALGAFGNGQLLAQEPFRQELIPGISTLDAGSRYSSPALADLDGDGDIDAVVGSGQSATTLVYFENSGSANAAVFVQQTGSADPFAGLVALPSANAELADLDGDGDFDLVAGGNGSALLFFENTGSSQAPVLVQRSGSANPFDAIVMDAFGGPDLADLDGDLDLDLALGVRSGGARYFANTGSALSPAFVERTGSANPLSVIVSGISVGYRSKPELADLDGDGDLDAVVGLISSIFLRYYENTGTSTAPAFVQRTGTAHPISSGPVLANYNDPQLADLDGDGDLDLLSGERYGSLNYFENTGAASAPALILQTGSIFRGIDFGRYAAPERVDLDGDGDFDLVVGSYGVPRYFENTGSRILLRMVERTGSANPFSGLATPGSYSRSIGLADLDGDGDLDALIGEQPGTVRYIENSGTSSMPAFVEQVGSANPCNFIDVGTRATPELADFDGDQDVDLLFGQGAGSLFYFENTGSSTAPAFVELTGTASPFPAMSFGSMSSPNLTDVDGDGDFDLAVASNYGFLRYFENTGTAAAPALVQRTGSASPLEYLFDGSFGDRVALADLDGDGDLDMLLGEGAGMLRFYRSQAAAEAFFQDGFESGDTTAWWSTVPGG